MASTNPTEMVNASFYDYVQASQERLTKHLIKGVPDYAYKEDFELRSKIKKLPGFISLIKVIYSSVIPLRIQKMNMSGLRVGPSQFPDIYESVLHCARMLGIGVPVVFIENDPDMINASTFAFDDEIPIIIITSALLERFTGDELRAVIGHECGHIAANHSLLTIAVEIMGAAALQKAYDINPVLLTLMTPMRHMLLTWGRAAEITCDRASIICSKDRDSVLKVQAKLISGGAFGRDDINIESILKQYDQLRGTPVRFEEIERDHPIPARRILAAQEFLKSEVLASWRPDWFPTTDVLLSRDELEKRTHDFVGIIKSKKRKEDDND
jgi:Zn-dependent protease with chaperone function